METTTVWETGTADARQRAAGGLVIGVWGAAGGVGTTSVATSMALTLASGLGERVCLIDLRVDGGDTGFLLGVNSWADWDGMRCEFSSLTSERFAALLPMAAERLKVFWLPETAHETGCTPGHIGRMIALARCEFDFVLLDIPAGWNAIADAAFEAADAIIVVTTPELAPVRRMRAAVVRTISTRPGIRPLLVLNHGRGRPEITPREAREVVGADFTAVIPHLPGLSDLWRRHPALTAIEVRRKQDASRTNGDKRDFGLRNFRESRAVPGFDTWISLIRLASEAVGKAGSTGPSAESKETSLAPEPRTPGWERLKEAVRARLAVVLGEERLDHVMDNPVAHDSALRIRVERLAEQVFAGFPVAAVMPRERRQLLLTELVDDAIGLGYVDSLLRDPSVTEIIVGSGGQVFAERDGKLAPTGRAFANQGEIYRVIERIVAPLGRRIDESSPMVDARLPDGSRVNAVIPPIVLDGPVLTIRKFAVRPFTIADLIRFGSLTPELAEFLEYCVVERKNIIVIGGAGSGKTTLLNVLSSFIPPEQRVITVEDAAELRLQQPNVSRLEARPPNIEGKGAVTIRDLVRNALRMRPDRIIVGEVRGGEALDMLQAMNTGHEGSLTTMHANSPEDALSRLETMVLMAGIELPVRAVREQIVSAVDLFIHQSRLRDGSRKVVEVAEVVEIRDGRIQLEPVFRIGAELAVDSGEWLDSRAVSVSDASGKLARSWRAWRRRVAVAGGSLSATRGECIAA